MTKGWQANGYVIVQHSGCGYTGNLGFSHGLETRPLNTRAERERVRRAGGLIFPTWQDAENFTEREMYPPGYSGLYPAAPGTFSSSTIDGLQIYLPGGAHV